MPKLDDWRCSRLRPRSLLSLMRHLHQDEVMQMGRESFIHRMMRGGVARVEGIAGAPFTIYYGEVSGDSDGPVEFCWPVPSDQAAEIAARFPDLTLRTEPAHQEAFVGQGRPGIWDNEAEAEVAIESLVAWASEQQRQPSGGVRMVLVFNPLTRGLGRTANSPWRCAEPRHEASIDPSALSVCPIRFAEISRVSPIK